METNDQNNNGEDSSLNISLKVPLRKKPTSKTLNLVRLDGGNPGSPRNSEKRDSLRPEVGEVDRISATGGPISEEEAARRKKKIHTTANILQNTKGDAVRKFNDEVSVPYDPAKIMKLLQAKYRTPHQAKQLLMHLIQTNSYFRSISEGEDAMEQEALIQLCKNIQYIKVPAAKKIFEEGDESNNKVFVVYSGELFVIVKKRDVITEMNIQKRATGVPETDSSSSDDNETSDNTPNLKNTCKLAKSLNKKPEDASKNLKKSQFGNLEDSGRNSTLNPVTKSTGIFMTLQKSIHAYNAPAKQNPPASTPLQRKPTDISTKSAETSDSSSKQLQKGLSGILIGSAMSATSDTSSAQRKASLLERRHINENLKIKTHPIDESFENSEDDSAKKKRKDSSAASSRKDSIDLSALLLKKRESEGLSATRKSRARKSSMWRAPDSGSQSPAKSSNFQEQDQQTIKLQSVEDATSSAVVEEDPEVLMAKVMRRAARYGVIKDTIFKGGVFGEMSIGSGRKRGATILTKAPCELLVIDGTDYMLIKQKYDVKKKKILDFMLHHIPEIEHFHSKQVIEALLYLLEERRYEHGNRIILEGTTGEDFYLLYDGTLELTKSVHLEENMDNSLSSHIRMRPTYKEEIVVSVVNPGGLVGEEVLIHKDGKYYYNVKVVSANATVFKIDRNRFCLRFPHTTRTKIREIFFRKQAERTEKVRQKISIKYKNMEIINEHRPHRHHFYREDGLGIPEIVEEDVLLRFPIYLKSKGGDNSLHMKLKMKSLTHAKLNVQTTGSSPTESGAQERLTIQKSLSKPRTLTNLKSEETNSPKSLQSPLDISGNKTARLPPLVFNETIRIEDQAPGLSSPISLENKSIYGLDMIKVDSAPKSEPLKQVIGPRSRGKSLGSNEEKFKMVAAHNFVPITRDQKAKLPLRTGNATNNYLENLNSAIDKIEKEKSHEENKVKKIEDIKFNMTLPDKVATRRYEVQRKYISKRYGTYVETAPDYLKSHNKNLDILWKKNESRIRFPSIEDTFTDLVTTRSTNGLKPTSLQSLNDFNFEKLVLEHHDIKDYLNKQKQKVRVVKLSENSPQEKNDKNGVTTENRTSLELPRDFLKSPKFKDHNEIMKWKKQRSFQLRAVKSKALLTSEKEVGSTVPTSINTIITTSSAKLLVSRFGSEHTSLKILPTSDPNL